MRSAADESWERCAAAGPRDKARCLTYSQFNDFGEKKVHYLAYGFMSEELCGQVFEYMFTQRIGLGLLI